MGIHNSSILSTERRVVNHNTFKPNMKAFMTACAVLASSANADPQRIANLVNLDQTVSHPGLIPMIRPYNVVPLNQVRYTNAFNYGMTHPLSTYGLAPVPAYIMEHRRMAQRPLISKMYMAAQRGMDRNHQMEGLNQMRLDRNQMDRNRMEAYRNQQQRLEDQMMIQRNHDAILVENMGQRNDQLHHQMAARPRQMDNTQQLGMTQMVQLMNHNLKNAVESHSETGKNMMNALESHEELGQNLRDAIQLYESTPETMGSRRYSNMRDAMVLNNNRNNMREGTMIHPQNQMIHTQEMRI